MSQEDRWERLTKVGPGTPGGNYMRYFWHPVAAIAELDKEPVIPVTLLGEKLVLFRGENGEIGLVAERCAHRGVSLGIGFIEGNGLRCAYHAWKYDTAGRCVDTPAEPADSTLKSRINLTSYPVQVMTGLVWAYLGKAPVPLLPRFEYLVREDCEHDVGISRVPCNWLQCAENNVDPYHIEFMHMMYTNHMHKRKGMPPVQQRKHAKIDFEVFRFGIVKKRLWEGDSEDSEEWTVGHPVLFPGTAVVPYPVPGWVQGQIRVPVDDTHTNIYWVNSRQVKPGATPRAEVPIWENPWTDANGKYDPAMLNAQDMMAMITQGPITDHGAENLATSDRGLVMYRRALLQQLEKVERGEDPFGVVRDPAENTPWIEIPTERHVNYSLGGAQASAEYVMPKRVKAGEPA